MHHCVFRVDWRETENGKGVPRDSISLGTPLKSLELVMRFRALGNYCEYILWIREYKCLMGDLKH